MEELNHVENVDTTLNKKFNRKLLINVLTYLICIIIYLVMYLIPKKIVFSMFNLYNIYNIIMIIAGIFPILGGIYLILVLIKKDNVLKLSNKAKKNIFSIFDIFVVFPLCICISTFVVSYWFTLATVDGGSMNPTLTHEENVILFYKDSFNRNDIVVIVANGRGFDLQLVITVNQEVVALYLSQYTDSAVNGVVEYLFRLCGICVHDLFDRCGINIDGVLGHILRSNGFCHKLRQ